MDNVNRVYPEGYVKVENIGGSETLVSLQGPHYNAVSQQNPPPPPYQPPPIQAWQYPPPPPQYNTTAMYASTSPVQTETPVMLISGGRTTHAVHYQAADTYVGPIVLSCIVVFFFNFLFGLIAFILAVRANNAAVYDKAGARRLGNASYAMSVSGIVLTGIIIAVTVGCIFGFSSAGVSSINYNICYNYFINGICYTYRYNYLSPSTCIYTLNGYYDTNGYCYYNN